jgi:hypothetical protein
MPKKINIYVRYTTENPSSDTIIWVGASSDNSPKFGASKPAPSSTSTNGLFLTDYFGEPMFNITVPGTVSGRNAGVIRRKIPTVVGGDELTTYQISQICDPFYDSLNFCQIRTTTNQFSSTESVATPEGIVAWKRIPLSWQYWNAANQLSIVIPAPINIATLPPPDPQICHQYSYKTPGCWFHWAWPIDEDDCYFWCSSCYTNAEYCDPVTYSF